MKTHFPMLTLWIALLAMTLFSDAAAADDAPLVPQGWRDLVISVSDFDRARTVFVDIGGWTAAEPQPVAASVLQAWRLPPGAAAEEVLLTTPDPDTRVRLIKFAGVERRQIRSSGRPWDTGGFFDITVMVPDMDAAFRTLQDAGWNGYSDPLESKGPPLHFRKVRMQGMDGLVLGLIERIDPPLDGWPDFDGFSHPFSMSLVTGDLARTRAFYEDLLGFAVYLEGHGRPKRPVETLSGFPINWSDRITGHYVIARPPPADAPRGRIEILAYDETEGRDFAEAAAPPNLGVFLLRYPVGDVDRLAADLTARGARVIYPPTDLTVNGDGRVRSLAVATPHGGWLEFFAPIRD